MGSVQEGQSKKKFVLIIAIVFVVIIIGLSLWAVATRKPSTDSVTEQQTTTQDSSEKEDDSQVEVEEAPKTTIDPETLSFIDIEPLGVTVSYVKGIPGFDYSIQRTQSRIEYVEFSSTELAGTKCTNDKGVFASIIKNPESDEDKTLLTSVTKVGEDSYGLSLPTSTCTSNAPLFDQYQASFKDAFGQLKAISSSPVTE